MACPHVAGVVALALQGKAILSTKAQAEQAMSWILNATSTDKIIFDRDFTDVSNLFKNKLIYSRLTTVVIDDPVILPDAPEEKGSKKMFLLAGVGLIALLGVVFALLS